MSPRFRIVSAKVFCLAFLLSGITFSSTGQPTYIQQWQGWFRYYNQAKLSDKLILHTELEERRRLNPWIQSQFFAHLHVHYRPKPWFEVAAGMNYNVSNSPVNQSLTVAEWRPWQEVSFFKKLGKDAQFQFRYRIDERFIHRNDKQVLLEGYHFNLRHRLRVQFSKPIMKFRDNRNLVLKLSDEVMLNSGDVVRVFDQNRLAASLEIALNKQWSIESGYVNLIQQVTSSMFSERHIIRTTAYHRIGFK